MFKHPVQGIRITAKQSSLQSLLARQIQWWVIDKVAGQVPS